MITCTSSSARRRTGAANIPVLLRHQYSRFDPICWGKAGICSNPAFKGLQQMRADVSGFALKNGCTPEEWGTHPCGPMTPRGDGWYRENML